MTIVPSSSAVIAACDWHLRQHDPAFAEWDALTEWLEADPAHAAAYAELAERDDALAGALASALAGASNGAKSEAPPAAPRRAPAWGWGAGAAGLAAAAAAGLLWLVPPGAADTHEIVTAPGARQQIALDDGSRITLNGATRVTLDRSDPRFARVHHGEALFDVVHDDDAPFRVEAGSARMTDLGTRFTVLAAPGAVEVAVSEGLVLYEAGAEAIRVPAGRRLAVDTARGAHVLGPVAPAAVGGFAEGQLQFDDATMARLAAELSRATGITVRVDPRIASRRVSAVLRVSEDRAALAQALELAVGLTVRQDKDGWLLTGG